MLELGGASISASLPRDPRSAHGLLRPRLRTAGPRLPRQGQALSAPALPGSLPHSVARHAGRSDPERPLRAPTPRRFPSETSHACGGRSARAETPIRHRSAREGNSGGLTPPPWVPRRRAVETSATSAERRRTRPGRGWFYMQSSQVKSSQVKLAISPLQNTSRRPFITSVV